MSLLTSSPKSLQHLVSPHNNLKCSKLPINCLSFQSQLLFFQLFCLCDCFLFLWHGSAFCWGNEPLLAVPCRISNLLLQPFLLPSFYLDVCYRTSRYYTCLIYWDLLLGYGVTGLYVSLTIYIYIYIYFRRHASNQVTCIVYLQSLIDIQEGICWYVLSHVTVCVTLSLVHNVVLCSMTST